MLYTYTYIVGINDWQQQRTAARVATSDLVPTVEQAQSDLHDDTIRQGVVHTELRRNVPREGPTVVALVFLAR